MRPPPRQLHTLPTPSHGRAARSGSADRPGSLRGDRAASPSSRLLYSTRGVERATAATQRRVRTAAPPADPRQHTSVATPMAMACLGSASGGATARRTDGAARRSSRAANRRIASAAPPRLRGGCPGESRMRPPPRQLHTLPTPPHGRAARSGSADRPGSPRGDRAASPSSRLLYSTHGVERATAATQRRLHTLPTPPHGRAARSGSADRPGSPRGDMAASPSSRLLYSTHGVERATAATQRRVRTAAPTLASTHPSPPRWRWRALARLAAE
ncbi:hypothetical protein EMIHUDRAFT_207025 [Emiliania huxleyi CCMP1516]|uniref:Uncharacterized protein n=2 Tax=Emiliania huxleyi TaxID=2903 RepID=A0A0D3JKG0_EMIH1|nr:hypothetical protein EMIHUDRAFT_207025 [Emiliania huxleyi CCMP1516]EOD23995.1 hypothetical protein EMIHUDRAFT_207025 [Emiliania huxleyi CCMP1516]|eukprot:XP_005776424.1 hypothetical protein EMIHUDRAFT_207025 [Emiliania huxleyi CCMP1516]